MDIALFSSDPALSAKFVPAEDLVVFSGGKFGEHSLRLSVSSPERVKAHWDGYCEANGAKAASSLTPKVRVRGLTKSQVAWCLKAPDSTGHSEGFDPDSLAHGATYIEGTVEELTEVSECLGLMADLVREEPSLAYNTYTEVSFEFEAEIAERAAQCCEAAKAKIDKVLVG